MSTKKIGTFPDGYRSQAFSGFIVPECYRHQHFHVVIEPTKYIPLKHNESLEAIFGMPKPSYFGVNLKPVPVEKIVSVHPPAEPAPSTSDAAKRELEAKIADGFRSPTQNSSFKSPLPSRKPDMSTRPKHIRMRSARAASTPRKLFPVPSDSFSSLGISELSFAESINYADSGFMEETLSNMEVDFTRLCQQQTRLEQRVETLEQEVAALRKDLHKVSGLVGELAAGVRTFIQMFT